MSVRVFVPLSFRWKKLKKLTTVIITVLYTGMYIHDTCTNGNVHVLHDECVHVTYM